MSEKVLISMLGRGQNIKGSEDYKETIYCFDNGTEYKSKFITKALIDSGYFGKFSYCFIIGTRTSSWELLAEMVNDEELWENLFLKYSNNSIDDKQIIKLTKVLEEKFKIKFALLVHTDEITNNTVEEIYELIEPAFDNISTDAEVIFDMTHGFRSASTLMYSLVLNRNKINSVIKPPKIVYGELSNGKSYIRELDKLAEVEKRNNAIRTFFTKFDAQDLVPFVNSIDVDIGSKLSKFSYVFNSNFAREIKENAEQLYNALKNFNSNKVEAWFVPVQKELISITGKLRNKELFIIMSNVADLYAKANLYSLAIITLYNSYNMFIYSYFKVPSEEQTFDEFKNKSEEFIESLTKSDLEKFHRFRNIRNVIAHGNSNEYKNNKNNKGNLKDEFEKASLFLRNIIFK